MTCSLNENDIDDFAPGFGKRSQLSRFVPEANAADFPEVVSLILMINFQIKEGEKRWVKDTSK